MGVHDGRRERIRERFLKNGLEGFAEHEMLEFLLYYTQARHDTNEVAHALMDRFGSLGGVLSAPVKMLEQVKGVGESTAVLLNLVPQIVQKVQLKQCEEEVVLTSVDSVGAYFLELIRGERNEVLYQLCLDGKGRLLASKRLGLGGVSSVNLDVRQLVENALLTSASTVILGHNHPSGIALPSEDDHTATDKAQRALAVIGVRLADHIIVADGDFVAFSESGYFSGIPPF